VDVPIFLRDVEVSGRIVSVRVTGDRIAAVGGDVRPTGDDVVIDAGGGALLRGLHDHHVHVHALAAAWASVPVGPREVATPDAFGRVLHEAAARGPVRAVGYHERVAGDLDRYVLDAVVAEVPVRVQHRTGALWILNSAALRAVGAFERPDDHRIERDGAGRPTGRLWRADDLVRMPAAPVDLAPVGAALARVGVTAITDATATNDRVTALRLADLPQRVRVMGPVDLEWDREAAGARATLGEVKVLLDDDRLPRFDGTVELIGAAHERGRGVAFHCVTLVQLQFALAALRAAGVRGDRIEHASVAPPEAIAALHDLGVVVSVQPSFVAERGDDYLRDVDARDIDALYPLASLAQAGVRMLGSTDAPYTAFDPWCAMRAAVDRRAPSGALVGAAERITPRAALALFGADRPVVAGIEADLVVLRVPLSTALTRLESADVATTVVAGRVVNPSRS
jgi:predicted amidohydrolase YtcJ